MAATGADDFTIRIWDYTTGALQNTMVQSVTINAIEYLPNGYFANAQNYWAGYHTINIWNPTNPVLSVGSMNPDIAYNVNALELLDNGDLVSGSNDGYIKVWDSNAYTLKYSLFAGFPVKCLKRLPNNRLASGLVGSNQIVVWDITNQNVLANLTGHSGKVNALEIDVDGNLASASDDTFVIIWSLNSYTLQRTLISHTQPINALKCIPNGDFLSGSTDRYIKLWNSSSGELKGDLIINSAVYSIDILQNNLPPPPSTAPISSTTSLTTSTTTQPYIITSTITSTTTITTLSSTISTSSAIITDTTTTTTITSFSSSSPAITSSTTSSTTLTTQSSIITSTLTSSTATTSLSTTNSVGNIVVLNSSFNFGQLNPNQSISLLESYDVSSCLSNCSNKGFCRFNQNKNLFECSCFNFYDGTKCQIDTRPCSSIPCLNNGYCIDYTNLNNFNLSLNFSSSSSFFCKCPDFYSGSYCEYKIDLCQNETCSGNGKCVETNNQTSCECFNLYEGDKCESQSSELLLIQNVISWTWKLASGVMGSFWVIIILMDLSKYCMKDSIKKISKKKKIKKSKVEPV
jgi:hypothetical protein